MTYHLAYDLDTPVGRLTAGLQVWVTGRKGDTMTIDLTPPPFPAYHFTVHRGAITYRMTTRDRARSQCGTDSGYAQHRARHEDACRDCRIAHNAYRQARRIRIGETTKVSVDAEALAELYLSAPVDVQQSIRQMIGAELVEATLDYHHHTTTAKDVRVRQGNELQSSRLGMETTDNPERETRADQPRRASGSGVLVLSVAHDDLRGHRPIAVVGGEGPEQPRGSGPNDAGAAPPIERIDTVEPLLPLPS